MLARAFCLLALVGVGILVGAPLAAAEHWLPLSRHRSPRGSGPSQRAHSHNMNRSELLAGTGSSMTAGAIAMSAAQAERELSVRDSPVSIP